MWRRAGTPPFNLTFVTGGKSYLLHIPAVLRLGKEQEPGWAPEPVWTPATDRITIPRSCSLVTIPTDYTLLDPVRYAAYKK